MSVHQEEESSISGFSKPTEENPESCLQEFLEASPLILGRSDPVNSGGGNLVNSGRKQAR